MSVYKISGRDVMNRKCITDRRRVLLFKMLRCWAIALLIAFLLATMFLTSTTMLGYAQSPEEEVLYEENFDDGQAQCWELERGWVVDDGMLCGEGHAWASYAASYWGEERVNFRFSLISLEGTVHANVRMSDMGRYAIGFEHLRTKEELYIYLFKQLGHDEFSSTLARTTIPYAPSIIVEIVTEGGKIQVYLRKAGQEDEKWYPSMSMDTTILEYESTKEIPETVDSTEPGIEYVDPNPLPPGTIAFETLEDSVVQIDDIVVIGVPTPAPAPEPTPEPESSTLSSPPALEPPDLMIFSTDYGFKNDGRLLVFSIGIKNQGYVRTPETLLEIREQDHEFPESTSPVPGLSPGETTTLEILQEIPEEQLGTTHMFLFEVDPHGDIPELDEDNNRQTLDILVPAPGGGVPWYWIIPVLLAGGAGYFLKRWSNRRQVKLPTQIQVRPQKDIGSQQVESLAPVRLNYEIRLRPVLDHGKQNIKIKGSSVNGKRRQG